MSVVVWITEGTWPACVAAARVHAAREQEIVLLYVHDDGVAESAHGAFAGLLGRGRPRGHRPPQGWGSDPGHRIEELGEPAARRLLAEAARRLGRPAQALLAHGRTEREVVQAATGAELLVCARDGDLSRAGPHSLGPATRFVVDHAPCPVLLVWPAGPDHESPPPPPSGPGHRR
ncbi:hypothetical protein GCM10010129_69520 [Streptomyces fumigatiscleroticus]|nr:hypothetical protein GCM10010129_69520 [Streptomyces fumigatiscleroticus]